MSRTRTERRDAKGLRAIVAQNVLLYSVPEGDDHRGHKGDIAIVITIVLNRDLLITAPGGLPVKQGNF
jgi:hypothetical protein